MFLDDIPDGRIITKILPCAVHSYLEENYFESQFFSRQKYSNGIRNVWKYLLALHLIDAVLLDKLFKRYSFNFSTLTAYPDPNPETDTVDGYTYNTDTNAVFSTVRGSNGGGKDDTSAALSMYLFASATINQYRQICRAYKLLKTSSIGATNIIDSATLGIVIVAGKLYAFNGSLCLVQCDLASNTAVANADHQLNVNYATRQATDLLISSINDNDTAYNYFTLNATGLGNISKTGITKFGVKNIWDADNTEPTWTSGGLDQATIRSADNTGTSKDPKLIVIYHTPGLTNIKTINGLAIASVKTINGLAIANVKTFHGVN